MPDSPVSPPTLTLGPPERVVAALPPMVVAGLPLRVVVALPPIVTQLAFIAVSGAALV